MLESKTRTIKIYQYDGAPQWWRCASTMWRWGAKQYIACLIERWRTWNVVSSYKCYFSQNIALFETTIWFRGLSSPALVGILMKAVSNSTPYFLSLTLPENVLLKLPCNNKKPTEQLTTNWEKHLWQCRKKGFDCLVGKKTNVPYLKREMWRENSWSAKDIEVIFTHKHVKLITVC